MGAALLKCKVVQLHKALLGVSAVSPLDLSLGWADVTGTEVRAASVFIWITALLTSSS
jgi:hypothetical protein